jgi:hypothetical protein
VHAREK